MNKLSELDLQKKQLLKAVRSNIRLKYSLLADEELNEKLPEIERQIEVAIQAGEEFELDIASVLAT